jgi:hypothetical protein
MKQESVPQTWKKIASEIAHMSELEDEDFKATIMNIF